ncbi:MAG: T9SS type B sorting domain-containing protein [Lutibacter sp.]|nr:T9SS type B sorting domain-containing protein [Lutibacter sp.]
MRNFIAILLLFCSLNVFAQGEANFWFFGENAGLNFNSGTPIPITGSLNTREGCSSFSDSNGNLLFYSDGTTVWNRLHTPMPNGTGLKGNASSTQSAMIIPKPGSTSIYYIFTVGAKVDGGEFGFNYYTIDMNAAAGLGDVISGPIDLSAGKSELWTEKVAAVKGSECQTFWVVSFAVNEFYAYKVSSTGVSSSPKKSIVSFSATDRRGYLKISPDGSKIAIAHMSNTINNQSTPGSFLLYDFNNLTGEVSNQRNLPLTSPTNKPYGVEFSSNSEKVYVSASNDFYSKVYSEENNPSNHFSTLYQFDLSSSAIADITASRKIIDSQNLFRGGLQLGPDQKIYRALSKTYNTGIPFLGVIDNPENDGLACNYKHIEISLNGANSTQGLPPFIASIFSQIEISTTDDKGIKLILNNQTIDLCDGSNFDVFPEPLSGTATYKWYFNNASTPFSNTANLSFKNLTLAEDGLYSLVVIQTDICGIIKTLKGEFSIAIHNPPNINTSFELKQCDEDGVADGFTDFNLNEANDFLTIGDTSLKVTYFLNYNDADSNVHKINASPFSNKTQTFVFARIENQYGCHKVAQINLVVSTTKLPSDFLLTITHCDDDPSIDGLNEFNLVENSTEIINQFPAGQNLSVSYYRNLTDAQLENNEINQSLPYKNETAFNQTLYVRVESEDNGACFGLGPHLKLTVESQPEFELDESVIYCLNSPPITISTYNAKGNYTYKWRNENGTIIGVNPFLEISAAGNYSVIATSAEGCESFSKTIKAIPSVIATISQNDIAVVDDSDNNSITIATQNLGIGDYEFSMDKPYGNYQDEPFFENVSPGFHTIYIQDKNSCGIASIEVSVIGYPKFFTPNNDGHNDTWNVLGVNENFFQQATVYIFNRFGKLITEIDLYGNGWNGTFNGNYLPATDYWFSVELVDLQGNVRVKRGHFSLIRR